MDYNDIFRVLHEKQVRYLLCGGLAVNIYGIPRMTADIDFLLDFEEENIMKFKQVMQNFGYTPSIPLNLSELVTEEKRRYYLQEKNLIAYSFVSLQMGNMAVDVLIDSPLDFSEMWEKHEPRKLSGYEMHIVSVEHLIVMKKHANRAQDQSDVILLSKFLEE